MFNRLRWWWHDFILRQWDKYYTVGGHCGFCGRWIPDAVVYKGWTWSMCEDAGKENTCYLHPLHRKVKK